VAECGLDVAFGDERGPGRSTRRTGSAEALLPPSLPDALVLYHYPTLEEPLTGWALGRPGWRCERSLLGDMDASLSLLTVLPRGDRATCTSFRCGEGAVGSRRGRYLAAASVTRVPSADGVAEHGRPGRVACTYSAPYRSAATAECRGVPTRSATGDPIEVGETTWSRFATRRGGGPVRGAVGVTCHGTTCEPTLIECRLRPTDRELCDAAIEVMVDPSRVRMDQVDATLACPRSVAYVRAGSRGGPPLAYPEARIVRTLRGDHELVVDAVPSSSIGVRYPAVCGGRSDRLWYRVRSVDGDAVNGWIAAPLIAIAGA
jgi:hypothetical protein